MEITIESGIPIPPMRPGTGLTAALSIMTRGQSFLVDKQLHGSVRAVANSLKIKIRVKLEGDKVRVWKL